MVRQIRSLPSLQHYYTIKESLRLYGFLLTIPSRCDSPPTSTSSSSSIEAFHSVECNERARTPQDKPWHSEDPIAPDTPCQALTHITLLQSLHTALHTAVRQHGEEVQPEMIRAVSSLLLAGSAATVEREKERVEQYMCTRTR